MERVIICLIILTGQVIGLEPIIEATLSSSTVHIGDEVVFTCRVKYANSMVILGKMVNFFEGDKETSIQYVEQISGGVDIYPKYTDEGRFHITTTQEAEWISYHLKISDITKMDSARYACNVLNTEAYDSKLLEVYSLPTKVALVNEITNESSEKVIFNEAKDSRVTCEIEDVVPLPRITIKIDEEDYTENFITKNITVQKPECYVGGFTGCLLHFANYISVTAPHFTPSYTSDGKSLTCMVELVGSGLKPVATTKQIEMHYSPKFRCDQEQVVSQHQKNAEIKCIVQANPSLQAVMFTFMWNAQMETLQPGSLTRDSEIHVTQTKINDRETEVTLIIKEVFQRHYLPYTLKASNQMGHNLTTIKLISTGNTSGANRISVFSSILYLFSLTCILPML